MLITVNSVMTCYYDQQRVHVHIIVAILHHICVSLGCFLWQDAYFNFMDMLQVQSTTQRAHSTKKA